MFKAGTRIAGTMMLAVLSSAAYADEVKLGMITKLGQSPWFVAETAGANAEAKKLGAELVYQDAGSDSNLALSSLDTFIGQGIKGLAIVVPDQAIGPAVTKAAAIAKIPVVAIDDSIKDGEGKPVPFVGFSAPDVGKQVGGEAAKYYKELGWDKDPQETRIAVLEVQTLSVCMQRTDNATAAFLSQVPAFKKENILHIAFPTTALEPAMSAMATVATANPNVKRWIVYSCSDEGILGPIRSLEQAGYNADSIIGIGLGGHLSCNEFKKPAPTGYRSTVGFDSAKHGAAAVDLLFNAVAKGDKIPENTIIPGFIATRETKAQLPGCK
jgi:L-arabinose transport system substrate-binding protein